MMALRSTETHDIALEDLFLFRLKRREFFKRQSDCEVCELLLLLRKRDRIFDSIEQFKTVSRD